MQSRPASSSNKDEGVSHHSFLQHSLSLTTRHQQQAVGKHSKQARKKGPVASLDAFFAAKKSTNPVAWIDLVKLVDQAISSVSANSAAQGIVLANVAERLVRPSSLVNPQSSLTTFETVLFVILKLSPVTAASFESVPRCVALGAEVVRVVEQNNALLKTLQWSCETDPIVDATIVGLDGDVSRWARGSKFAGRTAPDVNTIMPLAVDADHTKPHWGRLLGTEFDDFMEDMEVGSPPSRGLDGSPQGISSGDDESSTPGATPHGTSRGDTHARYQMYSVLLRSNTDEQVVIALHVALHRAMVGEADPYGLTQRTSPSPRRPDLESMRVNPHLHRSLSNPQADENDARHPIVGILEEACQFGTMYLRLLSFVAASARRDAATVLGSYGSAVVGVVKTLLHEYATSVCAVGGIPHGPQCVTFAMIVKAVRELAPLRDDISFLCNLFGVSGNVEWCPTASLQRCASASMLSRLHRVYLEASERHGNNTRHIARLCRLLSGALVPLHRMLTTWLHSSTLMDPYDEFFIAPSYGATSTGYMIRDGPEHLPSFLSCEVAEAFLNAGVSRDVLVDAANYAAKETDSYHLERLENILIKTAPSTTSGGASKGVPVVDSYFLLANDFSQRGAVSHWDAHFATMDRLIEAHYQQQAVETHTMNHSPHEISADLNDSKHSTGEGASTAFVETGSTHQSLGGFTLAPTAVTTKTGFETTAISDGDTVADQMQQQLEEAKETARQQILAEHEAKMKAQELQHKRNMWRSKRQGLTTLRNVALRTARDTIEEVYAEMQESGRETVAIPWKAPWEEREEIPTADADSPQPPPADLRHSHPEHPLLGISSMDQPNSGLSVLPLSLQPQVPHQPKAEYSPQASPAKHPVAEEEDEDAVRVDADEEGSENDPSGDTKQQLTTTVLEPGAQVTRRQLEYDAEEERIASEVDEAVAAVVEKPPEDSQEPLIIYSLTDYDIDGVGITEKAREAQGRETAESIMATYVQPDRFKARPWTEDDVDFADVELEELFDIPQHPAMAAVIQEAAEREMKRSSRPSSPTKNSPLATVAARRQALSLSQLSRYYEAMSLTTSRFYTQRAVRLLLLDTVGIHRKMIKALVDVCLMQRGVAVDKMLFEWSEAVAVRYVHSNGKTMAAPFDANTAYVAMARAFTTAWDAAGASKLLPLHLCAEQLTAAVLEQDSGEDVALPGNALELLPLLSLKAVGHIAEEWLLPPQAVRRYSDVFVCLVFWRWVQDLLKRVWQLSMQSRMAEVWAFCALTRGIFNAIIEHVWYGISNAATGFGSTLFSASHNKGLGHLGAVTLDHDEFLAQCFGAGLLSPEFAHARKYLRGMVRIVEEVETSVNVRLGHHGGNPKAGSVQQKVMTEYVRKRQTDFCSVAELFLKEIERADEGTEATSSLAALHRSVEGLLHSASF